MGQSLAFDEESLRPLLNGEHLGNREAGDEESACHARRLLSTDRPVVRAAALSVKFRNAGSNQLPKLVL